MRKQMTIALCIVVVFVVGGYLLFGLFFEPVGAGSSRELPSSAPSRLPGAAPIPQELQRINVVSVDGEVERRKSDSSWIPIEQGDELELDETIRANEDGRAVLDIGEIATVEIAPRSVFAVKEISKSVSRVRLAEGRLSAVVSGRAGSRLKVETKGSDAVAEAEKGEFSVLADGLGQISVATDKGRVRLSAKDKTVEVMAGMQSVVETGLPPAEPVPIPQTLFLKVARPSALITRQKETLIQGKTAPGAVISINQVQIAADSEGRFRSKIPLEEGKNQIKVSVQDITGRREEAKFPDITVDTKPPPARSHIEWGDRRQEETEAL